MSAPDMVTDRDYRRICEFLYRESLLLDQGAYLDWLTNCLDAEVRYLLCAPTLGAASPVTLMDETYASLRTRVTQLTTPGYGIAESPASFTRRHLSNILIDASPDADAIAVSANVLVYRSRGQEVAPQLFSIGRRDVLRRDRQSFRLLRREAMLDEAVVAARSTVGLF